MSPNKIGGASTFKYKGKKNVIQIKSEIGQDLGKVNGYPIQFSPLETAKEIRKAYGKQNENVKGFNLIFAIENKNGIVNRYQITSQNGWDTITNIYLIFKNIKQRVVDIVNGVTSIDAGFNDLKLLPIDVEADPYKVLGVTFDTPNEEIRRIYLELAKIYHPDKAGKEFEANFEKIQAAWEQLKRDRHIT